MISVFAILQECQLNEALKFNDGHICKRNPTDVAEFCLESLETVAKHFRGVLEVTANMILPNILTESSTLQENRQNHQESDSSSRYTEKPNSCTVVLDIQDKATSSASNSEQV